MARTASGLITQPSVEGVISDEAFNQLIQGLTTLPPGPTTHSIPGTNISGRTSSGKIGKTERDPAAEAAMGDEATRQALLAIMADKLGIDIRASLGQGATPQSIPGGGVSGRTAAGTITQREPAPEPDQGAFLDSQLQSTEGKIFRAENEKYALEAKLKEIASQSDMVNRNTNPGVPMEQAPTQVKEIQPAGLGRKLKPGELDKSPAMLAKYSDPNDIMATVDSKGQLSLSNTAQQTGAKIIQVNKEQADIQGQMDLIKKEMDINTREALLGKFHADQVEQQTEALGTFRAKAEQQLGITQLRQQLAEGIRTDQADPNYQYYRTDSQSTLRIRQMLQQSEGQVEKVTQEMATADPMFRKRVTEISDFIEMQQKQISQMLLRQSQNEQKAGQREEITAQKVDAATSVLTPIGIDIVASRNPELASDPEAIKIQAYNLLNSPATKLEAQMLLAMPDNLSVYQAAAMGATMADSYIAKKQQELTGDLPNQTMQDLKDIRTMVSPAGETMLEDAMKKYGTGKMKDEWQDQKAQRMLSSKTAEGRHQAQLQMLGNAIFLKSKEKEARFYNQVNSWKPINGVSLYDLPEVKELLLKNPSVSMKEMFQEYVGKAPKEVKAVRQQQLQDIATGNAKLLNAGMLGQITRTDDVKNKMTSYGMETAYRDQGFGMPDFSNPFSTP